MPRTSARYRLPNVDVPSAFELAERQQKVNAANARYAVDPLQDAADQARIARSQASEAQARYKLSKEIETDRQRTAFYNGLEELESALTQQGHGIGTKEHAEAFLAYAHEFPLARSAKSVQDTLKLHATVHDDQEALTKRIQMTQDVFKETGLQPSGGTISKTGDVSMKFKEPSESTVPGQVTQRYARVQRDIAQLEAASKAEEVANIAARQANVPFTKSADLAGAKVESGLIEKNFPSLVAPTVTPPPSTSPTPSIKRYNPETGDFE